MAPIQSSTPSYFTTLNKILLALVIVGAVNWGLIGFVNFNLVDAIFGGGSHEQTSGLSRVIYALVGLAGLGAVFLTPWANRNRLGTGIDSRVGVRP